MKTQKVIGITIISVIAVCLLLTSVAYAQNGVSFSGSRSGSTISGGGSSASVGEACSGDDPYVEKAVRVELNEAGEIDDEDSGHWSITEITPMGEVTVTVDAELVSAWVKVGSDTDHAIAEARISAQGEIVEDQVYVDTRLYSLAEASSESRKAAQAEASASGSAIATALTTYYDVGEVGAEVEGEAEASAKAKRNGKASAWAGLIAHSELGSLSDYSLLGSSSEVVGTSSKSSAEAESSVEGSASASGEFNDFGVVIESSQTSVTGKANTEAELRKGPGASAFAGAGSINYIPPPEEEEPYPFDINTFSLSLSGDQPVISLADASFLGVYTGGELNIYSGRITAEGSVEAETEAKGSLEYPDVVQSSETSAAGEASSSIDIRTAGIAESAAGAASVNLVDIEDGSLVLGVSYPVAIYDEAGELISVDREELLGVNLGADYALLVDASVLGSYSHTSYTAELDEFGSPIGVIIRKATAESEVEATTSASGESVIEDEVASSKTFASAETAKSYSKSNRNGEPWATSAAWVASLSVVDAGGLEIAHSSPNGGPIISGDFDVVTGSTIGTAAWGADDSKVKAKASLDVDIPEDEDAATSALASLKWDSEAAEASTNITTANSYSWLDAGRNRGRCTVNDDLVNQGDNVISVYDRSWSVTEDVNWADGYLWGLAYTPAP